MSVKKQWNIYFLLYDYVEVLDFSGSFDVFSMANVPLVPDPGQFDQGSVFKLHTVSKDGGIVTALHGLKVAADYSFATCPEQMDVLIIPGAHVGIVKDLIKNQPEVIEWINKKLSSTKVVASVCTGALILASAGGFDGMQCTTHHEAINDLEMILADRMADSVVIPGARYIDNPDSYNPRVLSSAGVSAGMDQAFYMLANILWDESLALKTANIMEYNGTHNWYFN